MNAKNINRIISIVCLLSPGSPVFAATVGFDDAEVTVKVGSVFSLNIVGNDFPNDVDGGGLNLSFDQDRLRVDSVTVEPRLWEFLPQPGVIDNAAGTVSEIQFNTFTQHHKGTFIIATLWFTALDAGISPLMLSESQENPFASGGEAVNPDFIAGKVGVISAVPIPSAFWLLLSGFAMAGRFRHRNAG